MRAGSSSSFGLALWRQSLLFTGQSLLIPADRAGDGTGLSLSRCGLLGLGGEAPLSFQPLAGNGNLRFERFGSLVLLLTGVVQQRGTLTLDLRNLPLSRYHRIRGATRLHGIAGHLTQSLQVAIPQLLLRFKPGIWHPVIDADQISQRLLCCVADALERLL